MMHDATAGDAGAFFACFSRVNLCGMPVSRVPPKVATWRTVCACSYRGHTSEGGGRGGGRLTVCPRREHDSLGADVPVHRQRGYKLLVPVLFIWVVAAIN